MDEILYLEADEEITSVVDKLKGMDAKSVSLVAPKGSTIVQSVVSLKLLKKEAESIDKKIAIITTDEVGRNLASRIGLPVFADTKSAEPLQIKQENIPDVGEVIEIDMRDIDTKLPDNFEIYRYDQNKSKAQDKEIDEPESAQRHEESEIPEKKPEDSAKPAERDFIKRPVSTALQENRAEIESARPISTESKLPPIKKSKRRVPLVVAFIIVGTLAFILLADLLLARATIDIAIPADALNKEVPVTVERDLSKPDIENGIIPGAQVQKEGEYSQTFEATGEKDAGEKATGSLTFKNEAGVDETIEAGATVASASGLEFVLQTTITVPKASLNSAGDKVLGQATGAVEAKNPGDSYNLPASTSYSVYGKSKISVSGGTSGGLTKKIRIVSSSDIESAKEQLQEKGKQELLGQVQEGEQKAIDGAEKVEVLNFSSTKNTNDEAQEFKATATIRLITLAYNEEQLKQASLEQIEKSLEKGKGVLATQSDTFSPSVASSDINIGKVSLNVAVSTHVGPAIDLTDLSSAWRFKTLNWVNKEAGKIPEAQVKQVSIWPKYALPITPILKERIIINLEYTKK